MKRYLLGALAALLALTACATPERGAERPPVEVTVSAAASLTNLLTEAKSRFESEHSSVRIRLNLGSSGALQQQIEQGAPVDLFIAAATGPIDSLVGKGLIDQGAVSTLAFNKVVLIRSVANEAVNGWADLEKARRVALGNPAHVPAGQYGKAVLEKLNLWGLVEPRVILGEDVRQVLQYVQSGEVDAGIVYQTDAAGADKVIIVAEAPAGSHPPVVYPMAPLKGARQPAEAKQFADFLTSASSRPLLTQFGFTAP